MKTHEKGNVVTFVAQKQTTLYGIKYRAGDEVSVQLDLPWNEEDGQGEGGPWGWGGYTAATLKRIGRVV